MATVDTPQVAAPFAAVPVRPRGATTHEALNSELQALFTRHEQIKPLFVELANLLARHATTSFAALTQLTADQQIAAIASHGAFQEPADSPVRRAYHAACHATLTKLDVFLGALPRDGQTWIITAPVLAPGSTPFALAVVTSGPENDLLRRVSVVEHVAAATSHWRAAQVMARLDWEARAACASVELISRVERCETVQAACYLAVDELARLFQCDRVAVALTSSTGLTTRLTAISGMSTFDLHSEPIQAIKNALDEALVRNETTAWPPLDAKDRHATLAHRKLAESHGAEALLSAPLQVADNTPVGAILLMGRRTVLHRPAQIHALKALAPHLAGALDTCRKAEPNRWQRIWRETLGKSGQPRRRWMVIGVALMCVAVPMCPWPHRIREKCTLEPTVRRFLVAPYDGILQSSFSRPGDLVKVGQTLARMDDRELRWELSSTIAERGRAAKERDVAMADNDTSETQLAALEMERLDLKIELLKHRERTLDITSPIDGVVLRGDLDDAEGAPVKTGQSLFEVAPLEKVKLELSVSEEELRYVRAGMKVTARLEGIQHDTVQGTVNTVFPRSEIRDGKNVFVAEVELQNPQQSLRPGMSGHARVHSGIKPLGWIWLHKAWHRLRNWIG